MDQQIFVVTRTQDSRWNLARPMERQEGWQTHAAFMNKLHDEGFVLLGGPLDGTEDVLLIVRASNPEQIRSRLSEDPWSRNGLLRVSQIFPWNIRLGSLG